MLELLLLLESTVSAAASTGPRSTPDTATEGTALDVEGFGDSTRVTGDLAAWDDARVTAPTVRTRFGEEVAVGERAAVARDEVGVVGAVLLLLLLLLLMLMVVVVLAFTKLILLLPLVLAVASGGLTTVAVVLVDIAAVGRSLMVVLRAGLGVLVFVGAGSTTVAASLVGVPGGDGLGPVPAAPTFAADDEPRSPHIGSKCFSFHGSNLLFSFSASVRSFIWFSGVNSPSDNRSRHSRHARAKNSLFKLDGFNRHPFRSQSPASSTEGRSTDGSSWTSLYWNNGGNIWNVCLFSSERRFVLTRIESGVSKSIQPSLVCSICAAVDIFLFDRRRGFTLNPGIDAKTSRIVDAGPIGRFSDSTAVVATICCFGTCFTTILGTFRRK